MTLSIVIPVYKNELTIGRTLNSIEMAWREAGQPDGLETVIVLDGIVDGSIDVIEAWRRSTDLTNTFIKQNNAGVGNARNAGWKRANSTWVTFLDADDEITSDRLEYAQGKLESGVAYVGCQVFQVGPGLRVPGMPESFLDSQGVTRFHFISMLIERSSIEAIGGFDPTFHLGNDWEFAVRLSGSGIMIEYVDRPFLIRHIHGSNMTMNEPAMKSDYLRAIRHHKSRNNNI